MRVTRAVRPTRAISIFALSGLALLTAGIVGVVGVAPAAAANTVAGVSITNSDVLGNPGDTLAGPAILAPQPNNIVGLAIEVANTGTDNLTNITVALSAPPDAALGSSSGFTCTFPDSSNGVTWAGPFLPDTQFGCVVSFLLSPVAPPNGIVATVTATGATTEADVTDSNSYYGEDPAQTTTLPITSSSAASAAASTAAVGINTGSTGPSNGNNALIWLGSGLMLAGLATFGWRATRIRLRIADGPRH